MTKPPVTLVLNRLLAIVSRSFPQYLQYSRPYIPEGRDNITEVIESIVSDQNGLADRISQMVLDMGGLPRSGDFPIEYTDTHDLNIDFLVNMAMQYQEQDIDGIAGMIDQLQLAPAAKSLAEESLGMAKGHLESLRELAAVETVEQ